MVTCAFAWLIAAAPVTGLAGQEPGAPQPELPRDVAEGLVAFYNASTTTRVEGDARVARGAELGGDLAVLGGNLELSGHVLGSVAVLNGSLRMRPGSEVDGSVTVVGGTLAGLDSARVGGPVATFAVPLRYRREEGRLVYMPPRAEQELAAGREFAFGRTDFVLAVHRGYNRVEGLPVELGPRLRLGHANPTVLSGRAIWRTEGGPTLDPSRMGYTVRVDQAMGANDFARAWVRARSDIVPIEDRGLTNRENSLATFIFHRDYRDEYRREGWSAGLDFSPPGWASTFSLEYRDERDSRVTPTDVLSFFDNDEPWRPEPIVAEGRLRSAVAHYALDTRNEPESPSSGWWVSAEVERGLGGSAILPLNPDGGPPDELAVSLANTRFLAGMLDLRRYARLGPESRLSTRIFATGPLDNAPLPPQRQHVLGGEGTLPGYGLLEFDCAARSATSELSGDSVFPYYGCDRALLVQLEYESHLPVGRWVQGLFGPTVDLSQAAAWVVFFDAGRAWNDADSRFGRGGGLGDFAADGGLGLRFGRLGLYLAVPLTGAERTPNFFVRIDPRF